jgi:putative tricarboxylic transport membrane protein
MIEHFLAALSMVFTPTGLLIVFAGAVLGILIGAIPGLGGAITLALLIPFSFGLDSSQAILLLIAALGGVNYGGSIPAIMLNIPGTAPSVVTTLDGYQMTKNNESANALTASAIASGLGAIIGGIFLFLSIPVIRQVLLLFGPPEFLLVAVVGLITVASVVKDSVVNGLIGVCFGIMLGFHGFNQITGSLRFDFGSNYLFDGISIVVVVVGMFAIGEMLVMASTRQSVTDADGKVTGNVRESAGRTLREFPLIVKSSLIGIGVGLIPAVGGTVSTLVSYAQAKASSGTPEMFGQGDIRGVIAPEASNDAKDGASLLPTLAFSIPGTPSHAVLLGGLLVHGVTPGPSLFSDADIGIVFIILVGLILSNIITSVLGISLIKYLVRISLVPSQIIIPLVVVISMFGAYAYRGVPQDMLIIIVIGIIGFATVLAGVSRVAILFGLILGPIIENTFHQTLSIATGDPTRVLYRPVFAAFLVLLFVGVLLFVWRVRRR